MMSRFIMAHYANHYGNDANTQQVYGLGPPAMGAAQLFLLAPFFTTDSSPPSHLPSIPTLTLPVGSQQSRPLPPSSEIPACLSSLVRCIFNWATYLSPTVRGNVGCRNCRMAFYPTPQVVKDGGGAGRIPKSLRGYLPTGQECGPALLA